MRYRRRNFIAALASSIPSLTYGQSTENPFIRLWATNKISVELPRSWSLIDEGRRIDLAAVAESVLRRTHPNQRREPTSLPLAANRYVDTVLHAWMNIRVYPGQTMVQREVRDMSVLELEEFDRELRKEIQTASLQQNLQIIRWRPTQKHQSRARLFVLLTEYDRTAIQNRPPATVILARVLAGSESFTLTVAFTSSLSILYRPVALEMIESLRIG